MMAENTPPDLLPCPFCGGKPIMEAGGGGPGARLVNCCTRGCPGHPCIWGVSDAEAAGRWNTRAADPVVANLAELLKCAADRLERCKTSAGTDPEVAAAEVEPWRAAIASATSHEGGQDGGNS